MNDSSVVVTAQRRERVKLRRVVGWRMVVPIEAVVGHMVRTVVAVGRVGGAHPLGAEAVLVVAIVVVNVADLDLVAVASCIPLQCDTLHSSLNASIEYNATYE